MKSIKRILSLLLAFAVIISVPAAAPPARSDSGAEQDGSLRAWFLFDPIGGVELSGQKALEQLGEEIADILIEVEGASVPEGNGDAPLGVFSAFSAYSATTVPQPPLDMSVYDVVGFSSDDKDDYWDAKEDDDGVVAVSSAYEAAEYFMYRIMAGGDETGWKEGTTGVYAATFRIDTGGMLNIPWDNGRHAEKIAGQISEFICAYFPHYFYLGGTANPVIDEDGKRYTDVITVELTPTTWDAYRTNNIALWEREYAEAEALIENNKDVYSYLSATYTSINSGDDAQKLKNAYDYIAKSVTYDSRASQKGQLAYCALIEKRSVCNGYALATSMLCLRMGLNVPYMSGVVPGGLHAWNLNLDAVGAEYGGISYPDAVLMVDTTWGSGSGGKVNYQYYNVPLNKQPRTYGKYYMSYIAYVNTEPDDRQNLKLDPGMVFEEIANDINSLTVKSDGAPTIDLTYETIDLAGFSAAAYSLDGGVKWKKGPLPSGAKFEKLFNKGMTLWLADSADSKGKPAADAKTVKFPKINARPKTKYKPYYSDEIWVLADSKDKTGKPVTDGIEYADTAKGKTPLGEWKEIPESGFAILSGKRKVMYLVRISPRSDGGGFTPAGKQMKVKPANYGKAPKYNPKKGNIITLKKGDVYAVDNTNYCAPLTAKKDFKIGDFGGSVLYVKKAATGKKPATEVRTIILG